MGQKAIINAVNAFWKANSVLNQIQFRTSRINTGETIAYALINVKDIGSVVDSGRSYVKKYRLTVDVYGDASLTTLNTIAEALTNAMDWRYDINIVGADIMLWRPETDDSTDVDDKDYYGNDVRKLHYVWHITLNEDKVR